MSYAPKAKVVQAIKRINKIYGEEIVQLIDWSSCGDGYAIWAEFGVDALDISYNEKVRDAMPEGFFLEPINAGAIRLCRI